MKVGLRLLFATTLVAGLSAGNHEDIGIPLAEKIKATEDNLLVQPLKRSARDAGETVASIKKHPYLGQRITALNYFIHPKYHPDSYVDNDIAVIYLPRGLNSTNLPKSYKISLPEIPSQQNLFGIEKPAAVALGFGWNNNIKGAKKEDAQVTLIQLKMVNENECSPSSKGSIICATLNKNSTTCGSRFSGGPIFLSRNKVKTLIGVTSYRDCDTGYWAGTSVSNDSYLRFIKRHL